MFFNDEASGQDEQDSYPDSEGEGLTRRSHSIIRFVLISSYDTWTKRKRKTTTRSSSSQSREKSRHRESIAE
ncbi:MULTISPECIES: hypothetical protein [Bacillaceae]|uniref:hypothetical protein n=1 Tax=Bacillaceae TaxID=186817 RepID=UPI002FFFC56B